MSGPERPGEPVPDPDATQPFPTGTGDAPPGYGQAPAYGAPPPADPGTAPPTPGYGTPPTPGYGPQPPTPGYGTQPGYGSPPSFPAVTGPQPAPGRPVLPFVAGLLVGGGIIGAGLWYFLAGPGAPADATPTPTSGAVVTPSASPTGAPLTFTPPSTDPPTTSPPIESPTPPSPPPATPTTGTTGSPTTPTPSVPTPTAGGPGPSIDPAIEAEIREVQEQVPPIRGLEPTADVPFRFISEDQFRVEFEADFRSENPVERIAAEEAVLHRLGMLGPDQDLEALILSLYQSQVAAFYDPRSGAFTIIAREGFEFGPDDRFFAAHEYDHALQDQHYDLEGTRITDPSQGDRALAELALIEGDATALMFEWALQHLDFAEFQEIIAGSVSGADQALLDSMPPILRRQLEFPYLDGYAFVAALRGQGGSWSAVDEAWLDRPVSTEQILHPERYVADELPIAVELPDLAAALGQGWTVSSTQTLGEMVIGVWVADGATSPAPIPGFPAPLPNAEAAAGWGGDRLVSLDGPNGAWAVAWQTTWDSEPDGDEFVEAAEAAMADLPGEHSVTRGGVRLPQGSPVLVLIASDEATHDALRAAFP